MQGWKLSSRYVTPPMPFALTPDEALDIGRSAPNIGAAKDVYWPPGTGIWRILGWPGWDELGFIRRNRPSVTVLDFA